VLARPTGSGRSGTTLPKWVMEKCSGPCYRMSQPHQGGTRYGLTGKRIAIASVTKVTCRCSPTSVHTRISLTLGIFGPWGSGKTSLMQMLLGQIEATMREKKRKTLWFNAWMYEGREEAQSALTIFDRAVIGCLVSGIHFAPVSQSAAQLNGSNLLIFTFTLRSIRQSRAVYIPLR